MRKIKFSLTITLIIVLLFSISLLARSKHRSDNFQLARPVQVSKTTKSMVNLCNWGHWIFYDGVSAHTPDDDSGGFYPRGTSTVIFTDGVVWGGLVDTTGDGVGDHIRVGGQTYSTGTQPGWIKADGSAVSIDDDRVRIYRIRSDWESLTEEDPSVIADATELGISEEEVLEQYEYSWNNWPADLGAPTYEDGTPGIADADQVLWLVVNDLDPGKTTKLYGSPPIGLELQITMWAYNQPTTTLGQILFKKYKLINKSGMEIDSMFISQWSDPDVGTYTDDLVGCDTDLSLGFAYTGFKTDNLYDNFDLPPAAVGYDFFQGPMVDGVAGQDLNNNDVDDAQDYAVWGLKKVGPGKINLPMTSFGYFAAGSAIDDPDLNTYDGTLQWYNLLNGMIPNTAIDNPSCFTHGSGSNAGQCTQFPVDGDPFRMTGDLDAFGSNLPPGDRRMCLNSGPFTMAPGDTQEVVVAVVGGIVQQEGGDNRNAVEMLKINDRYAQFLYDNLFQGIPSPPKTPVVTKRELDQKVVLEWGSDLDAAAETEAEDPLLGFDFQGYNVYQLPSATASKEQATLIATYDIKDNIMNIKATRFLASVGDLVEVPIQKGSDTGIKRSIVIDWDEVKDQPLYNGSRYYYAVTAYNYNDDPDVPEPSLESALNAIEVVPQKPVPGTSLAYEPGGGITATHATGTAGGDISVSVIDPYSTTGHEYEVFFNQQHYYLDKDANWKTTNYPDSVGKGFGKVTDVSPSTITGVAYTATASGTRDLMFILDLVSPDYDYAEGVKLTFPPGITINSASCQGGITALINESENTVLFGNEVKDSTDLTGAGAFSGGEVMTVNVNTPTLPLAVDYVVYDDGWAYLFCQDPDNAATCEAYGISDAVVVNAEGTCIISEEAYKFKTVKHWNLKDVTTDEVVLEDQTIVNGVNLERVVDGVYYSGGDDVGVDAAPIADGLQLNLNILYSAPSDWTSYTHVDSDGNEDVFSVSRANAWLNYDQHGKPYIITSYAQHGWSGGDGTARSVDAYGYGTTDVNLLQRDYEIRFTGEYDAPVTSGGLTYYPVKEGTGSKAVLYGARNYDIDVHPDANNPGDGSAFFVQIPFEVWDTEVEGGPQQVCILIYDRMQAMASGETVYAFNESDRMYCEFLNVPYDEVIAGSAEDYLESDYLTWNTVWWNCDWTQGDVVEFLYDNPIQLGVDKWTFETTAPTVGSDQLAKDQVKKINVFPNPYYAYNVGSTGRFNDFVTFSHLPEKVAIRIFNLAGVLVRTLEKENKVQFMEWDLRNESDLPVASGAYIAHIDMPDLNEEKILKFFIIQDKQVLEFY